MSFSRVCGVAEIPQRLPVFYFWDVTPAAVRARRQKSLPIWRLNAPVPSSALSAPRERTSRQAPNGNHFHALRVTRQSEFIRPTSGCAVTRSQTNQLLNGTQGSAPGRAHSSGGKRLVLRRAVSSALSPTGAGRYFLVSAAAKNRSSDSTSPGSATVSAISWRKSSRYLLRSL